MTGDKHGKRTRIIDRNAGHSSYIWRRPALVVLVYYFSRKAKNKERMALIEKGVDASIYLKRKQLSYGSHVGMLMGGIGLDCFWDTFFLSILQ